MCLWPPRQFGVSHAGPLQFRNQTGKCQVVVVMREREGCKLPAVFKSESAALGFIAFRVAKGTEIVTDESTAWNDLHARYALQRIDHQKLYSETRGVYTNGATEFFSLMRRAEIRHHHHVARPYLVRYAQESAWREDHRRLDNAGRPRPSWGWRWRAGRALIGAGIDSATHAFDSHS